MTAQTMSYQTKSFIKNWNASKSNIEREKRLKFRLSQLFLNKDLIVFLDEFTNQFSNPNRRFKMLLLCRKLLVQAPPQIRKEVLEEYAEEYYRDVAQDTTVTGIQWIEEELSFIKEVKDVDEILEPLDMRKKAGVPSVPLEPVMPNPSSGLIGLEEALTFFRISKSTFDRWRKSGFPFNKVGKKLFVDKEAALKWIASQKTLKDVSKECALQWISRDKKQKNLNDQF